MKEQDKNVNVSRFGVWAKMLILTVAVVAGVAVADWISPRFTNSEVSAKQYADSHQEEFAEFVKECGSNITQVNSGQINDLGDYKCRIATNPSVVLNIIRSLIERRMFHIESLKETTGSSILFAESLWAHDFLSRTNDGGLDVWKNDDSDTVSKEFQNEAFLLWTLLNRFENRGVQSRTLDITGRLNDPSRKVITLRHTVKERGCNFDLVIDIENGDGRYEFEPGCRGQGV